MSLNFEPLKYPDTAILQQQITDTIDLNKCLRQVFTILADVSRSLPRLTKHTVMQLCQHHLKA